MPSLIVPFISTIVANGSYVLKSAEHGKSDFLSGQSKTSHETVYNVIHGKRGSQNRYSRISQETPVVSGLSSYFQGRPTVSHEVNVMNAGTGLLERESRITPEAFYNLIGKHDTSEIIGFFLFVFFFIGIFVFSVVKLFLLPFFFSVVIFPIFEILAVETFLLEMAGEKTVSMLNETVSKFL